MFETFDDEQAISAHDTSPAMADIYAAADELLAAPPRVLILDPVADIAELRPRTP